MKTCTKCLQLLPKQSFTYHKGYLRPACRKCCYMHYSKPHRERNRKPRVTKEKISKPQRIIKTKQSEHQRRKNDPVYKMGRNIRKRLKKQLDKGFKIGQTSEMLGCSLIYLKAHLETQFYADMTWDNYGSYWHIDHIKPICSFDLTKPNIAKQVNHFTNLRPLKAEDNLAKAIEDAKLKFVTVQLEAN